MAESARTLLDNVREDLKAAEAGNRLVPLVMAGTASRSVFGLIAAEETRIVPSDWRAFLTLAARSQEPAARQFFSAMADGERLSLAKLPALAAAGGMDEQAVREYQPMAGCQGYPSYVAWLALNAEPADVIVALCANFAAFGEYCGALAAAMRDQYGLDEEASGFFGFFATPAPDLEALAESAVQAAVDAGQLTGEAPLYARLFQEFELMFWNTVADA